MTSNQEDFLDRLNRFFASLAGWSFDHRWWVVALALSMLAGAVQIASQAQIDNSFESYFDAGDSTYEDYLAYRASYGSDETSYLVYSAPGVEHGPWDLSVMESIVHLTEALEDEVPFIYEVQSLANAELMVGSEDGIEIIEIWEDFPESQQELLELRELYLAKPMMVGGLVSEDAQVGGIVLRMDRTSTDPVEDIRFDPDGGDGLGNLYPQVTHNKIEEILARPEYAGVEFHHTGDVPLNALLNILIGEESFTLGLATAVVVALLLLFFFRSFVGVIAPTLVIQLGVVVTVAFVVAMGWKLDLSFGSIPTLMTAIGVAHSVHILSEFRSFFAETLDRRTALVRTLGLVGTPALLSTLTTAVGFASMSFSPIKSVAHMGTYSAVGILAIFVLSLTLLMALLSFGPRTPRKAMTEKRKLEAKGGPIMVAFLEKNYRFVIRWRKAILGFFSVLILTAIAGIFMLKVDSNWLDDFSDSESVKVAAYFADEHMGAFVSLILLIEGEEPGSLKSPEAMQEMTRIEEWALEHPLVGNALSISGIVRDLNQTFNEGKPEYYVIPESQELIAQYMLLYETAGGTDANRLVKPDYSSAQLDLRLRLGTVSETREFVEDLNAELQERPLEFTTAKVTGIQSLWLILMEYITTSQIQSFLIAFSAIGLLLCLVFRSLAVGGISMIPNVFPSLLTLGIMGWVGNPLDYNKLMLASVAMGIAVDDTVHMLSRFRHEFRVRGRYEEALRAAMLDVGRALTITSVILVVGFLVLVFSALDSKSSQGLLLGGTIVSALVADFLLMPALVLTLKPFGKEKEEGEGTNAPPTSV